MKKLVSLLVITIMFSFSSRAQCTAGTVVDTCKINEIFYLTGAPTVTNNWLYLTVDAITKVRNELADGASATIPGMRKLSDLHRVLDSTLLTSIDARLASIEAHMANLDTLTARKNNYTLVTGTCVSGTPFTVPANAILLDVIESATGTHKIPISGNFSTLPSVMDIMFIQSKLAIVAANYETAHGLAAHNVTCSGFSGYYVYIQFW